MILTYLALVGLVVLSVALRLAWPTLSSRYRHGLLLTLTILLLPALLSSISRWDTTSPHLNAALFWIQLFACELCVVAFSLIRPRLLTSAVSGILTLPLFSSSVAGPAAALFSREHPDVHPITAGYFIELLPWSSGAGENGGADFTLFYQPRGMHLLRRPFMGARLYDTQCRTAATTASVNLQTSHITVHCPPFSSDPGISPSGTELDYIIPRGARSPALASGTTR